MKRVLAAAALAIAASSYAAGACAPQEVKGQPGDPKATPAYGVLVLRKVAVEAELAEMSAAFTASHPDVRSKRFEFDAVGREIERVLAVEKSAASRLSETYGKLVLRKVALEVGLEEMLGSLSPRNPDVKRAQVELAALEREIEKILR